MVCRVGVGPMESKQTNSDRDMVALIIRAVDPTLPPSFFWPFQFHPSLSLSLSSVAVKINHCRNNAYLIWRVRSRFIWIWLDSAASPSIVLFCRDFIGKTKHKYARWPKYRLANIYITYRPLFNCFCSYCCLL